MDLPSREPTDTAKVAAAEPVPFREQSSFVGWAPVLPLIELSQSVCAAIRQLAIGDRQRLARAIAQVSAQAATLHDSMVSEFETSVLVSREKFQLRVQLTAAGVLIESIFDQSPFSDGGPDDGGDPPFGATACAGEIDDADLITVQVAADTRPPGVVRGHRHLCRWRATAGAKPWKSRRRRRRRHLS